MSTAASEPWTARKRSCKRESACLHEVDVSTPLSERIKHLHGSAYSSYLTAYAGCTPLHGTLQRCQQVHLHGPLGVLLADAGGISWPRQLHNALTFSASKTLVPPPAAVPHHTSRALVSVELKRVHGQAKQVWSRQASGAHSGPCYGAVYCPRSGDICDVGSKRVRRSLCGRFDRCESVLLTHIKTAVSDEPHSHRLAARGAPLHKL